jgi:hypothetical protein
MTPMYRSSLFPDFRSDLPRYQTDVLQHVIARRGVLQQVDRGKAALTGQTSNEFEDRVEINDERLSPARDASSKLRHTVCVFAILAPNWAKLLTGCVPIRGTRVAARCWTL